MRQKHYTLKREPGDFVVEELLDLTLTDQGRFALYRLSKQGLDTPTALNLARVALRVDAVPGHCGMKDRYSRSVQHFTVPWGPDLKQRLKDRSISAELVGRVETPLTLGSHRGNRFTITIRDLSSQTMERIERSLKNLAGGLFGESPPGTTREASSVPRGIIIPNYFDSQRFTYQLMPPDDPVTNLMEGKPEEALRCMTAAPFRKERRNVKNSKRAFKEHWGDWKSVSGNLPADAPKGFRRLAEFLIEYPADFTGALEVFGAQALKTALNSHQSYHWNRVLEKVVARIYHSRCLVRVKYQAGELLLPNADQTVGPGGAACFSGLEAGTSPSELLKYSLSEDLAVLLGHCTEGTPPWFDPGLLRTVPYERLAGCGPSPSSHPRPLFVNVGGLEVLKKEEDLIKLRFELPAGAYATVVVKMLAGC